MPASLVLLALALHAAPADPLAPARDAFAAGDYARAESLALFAATPPRRGEGLYLAALARFRQGRPQDALRALDAAARAADPPERGRWLFNRGACLYALGRLAEAEAAFVGAARADASLAAVALADAGFAALDAGATGRARAHAASARATASGSALALVEDLEAALAALPAADGPEARRARATASYREALGAFDAGRFAEARRGFERAAELAPDDGRAPLMAGAAALRLGERRVARADVRRALSLSLDAADARIARDYLAEASHGLASRPGGWALSAHAGGGLDDNVLQSGGGSERAPAAAGRVASAHLLAGLGAAWRWRPRATVAADAAYALEQAAYAARAAEDYGLQQHVLAAALEVEALPRLRLGISHGWEATFTGRSSFRVVDVGPSAGAWAALDACDAATTRLDVEVGHRGSPRAEFVYLSGDRLEIALGQQLRLGPLTLDASWRHRVEWLGTLAFSATREPEGACGAAPCPPTRWLIPFGSTADTLTLAARAQRGRVQLLALAGFGWRTAHADTVASLDGAPPTVLGRTRRRDERAFGGAAATLQLLPWLSATGRWDVARNTSNLAHGRAGHELDYDDRNYTKHAATLEATVAW